MTNMPACPRQTPAPVLAITLVLSAVIVRAEPATSAPPYSKRLSHQTVKSDWSRVLALAPGASVIVTVSGSPPVTRHIVSGTDAVLTILDLDVPMLPPRARDVLRGVATTHPEYFAAVQKGGTFVLGKNVRMDPNGIFVAERKIADLEQIVTQLARPDIVEIKATAPSGMARFRHSHLGLGTLLGACAGFAVGIVVGEISGHKHPDSLLPLFAPIEGGLMGLLAGSVVDLKNSSARHNADDVIYRAP